jgi:hypothetical protein
MLGLRMDPPLNLQGHTPLQPDYTKPVAQVYGEVSQYLMKPSTNLGNCFNEQYDLGPFPEKDSST